MTKQQRVQQFKNYLDEALTILDEDDSDKGIRLAKESVKGALKVLGKIASHPKRGNK